MQMTLHMWPVDYRWSRRDWCAVSALVIIAFGVYANSLPNDFVYDDHTVVVSDQRSHSLSRIGELFSGGYWTVTKRTLYRPITLLSFALNHAVTGLSAPGYRAVNLALHALVCVAVYRLMIVLFGRFWPAAIAGAVYAVHPIHVEAVVPIVGRSELLSALGITTAMVLYATDAARGGRGVSWRYVAVLALFWTAMLSKESGVALIGLVVAFDIWRRLVGPPGQREAGWEPYLVSRFFWRYAGLFGVLIIVLAMRRWALGMVLGEGVKFPLVDNPLAYQSWLPRLLTGLVLFGKYVRLLVTGYPLCCDYSHQAIPVARSMSASVAWGLICLTAATLCIITSLRRRRQVVLPVVWFLISYAPVGNVLILIGTIFAERLMYAPSIAVAMVWGLAVPGTVAWLREVREDKRGGSVFPLKKTLPSLSFVCVLIVYGTLTVLRNRVWRDDETLYRDGLVKQPNSARCQYNMGAWYASYGQMEPALNHLQRAVQIASEYYLARTKLATCYSGLSRWRDVVDVLEPLVGSSFSRSEHLVSPLCMLGTARMELGQFAEAWDCFQRVYKIDSQNAAARCGQARIRANPKAGAIFSPSDAWALAQEAVRIAPGDLSALLTAGRIALQQHRIIEAQVYIDRAINVWRATADKARKTQQDRLMMLSLRSMGRELDSMRAELTRQIEARRSKVPWAATLPEIVQGTTTATAPGATSRAATTRAGPALAPQREGAGP
jgi:tetratricopeptide (TPR) repeat protein